MFFSGKQAITNGATTVTVVFPEPFTSEPRVFPVIQNTSADVTKLNLDPTISALAQSGDTWTGFTVKLNQATNSGNYFLVWSAGAEQSNLAAPIAQQGVRVGYLPSAGPLRNLTDIRIPVATSMRGPTASLNRDDIWGSIPAIASAPASPHDPVPFPLTLAIGEDGWLYIGTGARWRRVSTDGGDNWQHQPWTVPFREGEVTVTPVPDQTVYTIDFPEPFTGAVMPRVLISIAQYEVEGEVSLLTANITARDLDGFTVTFNAVPTGPVLLFYLARQYELAQGGSGGPDGGGGGGVELPIEMTDVTGLPAALSAIEGDVAALDSTVTSQGSSITTIQGQLAGLDDVREYANLAAFPVTGVTNTLYIAIDTGYTYRWTGSVYAQIGGTALAFASQAEAEAGVENSKVMTALRVAQAIAVLASGTTITNMTLANGANTLASPGSGTSDGQKRMYRIKQPASGAAGTVTLNSIFRLPAGVTLAWSTTNGLVDVMGVVWNSSTSKWDVLTFIPGYSGS